MASDPETGKTKSIMAMNDPSSGELDGLLEILGSGVTNVSPQAALPILQNWQAQLQALPFPHAQKVAGDLAQLSDILGSEGGMGTGTDVGSLLVTLAGNVRGLIGETEGVPGLSDKLTQLASVLEAQGTAMNDSNV